MLGHCLAEIDGPTLDRLGRVVLFSAEQGRQPGPSFPEQRRESFRQSRGQRIEGDDAGLHHLALQPPLDTEKTVRHGRDGQRRRQAIEARKACCDVRKVRPLNKALKGAAGWLTGLRRDQSSERAHVPFAVWDGEHQLVKLNPIADWSLEKLEAYIAEHAIPVNPLHARGFPSIGCQPCTRAIRPGEDIRAGRWWWENEDGKECGLHNRPKPKEAHA